MNVWNKKVIVESSYQLLQQRSLTLKILRKCISVIQLPISKVQHAKETVPDKFLPHEQSTDSLSVSHFRIVNLHQDWELSESKDMFCEKFIKQKLCKTYRSFTWFIVVQKRQISLEVSRLFRRHSLICIAIWSECWSWWRVSPVVIIVWSCRLLIVRPLCSRRVVVVVIPRVGKGISNKSETDRRSFLRLIVNVTITALIAVRVAWSFLRWVVINIAVIVAWTAGTWRVVNVAVVVCVGFARIWRSSTIWIGVETWPWTWSWIFIWSRNFMAGKLTEIVVIASFVVVSTSIIIPRLSCRCENIPSCAMGRRIIIKSVITKTFAI